MGLCVPSWMIANDVALEMTAFTNRLCVNEIKTKPWSLEQDVVGALIAHDLLNA
jgi:hypothetical protein